MGYETRLYIGKSTCVSGKEVAKGELIIENGDAYRPYLKNDDGSFVYTERTQTWFEVMAMVDLCKAGYSTEISKVDWKNTDKNHFWYWYVGNEEKTEDNYGDSPKPVPISVVLDALKKDYVNDDYRRFKWAIALLESMQNDEQDELSVLFYGH